MSGRRAATILIASLVGAVGCGGNRWPEEMERNFRDACARSAAGQAPGMGAAAVERYCDCALGRLRARYTAAEFARVEADLARQGHLENEQLRLVADCAPAAQP